MGRQIDLEFMFRWVQHNTSIYYHKHTIWAKYKIEFMISPNGVVKENA
jgi:hypothetical protein